MKEPNKKMFHISTTVALYISMMFFFIQQTYKYFQGQDYSESLVKIMVATLVSFALGMILDMVFEGKEFKIEMSFVRYFSLIMFLVLSNIIGLLRREDPRYTIGMFAALGLALFMGMLMKVILDVLFRSSNN